ncbi:MAG TPA: hypothetical protein VHS59_03035 [Bacillota bacterium]|nr:hypothetical protein [Bacillota bacterium]
MGDKISTAAKITILVLVFGTFLAIYFKPGIKGEQPAPLAPQSATNTDNAKASSSKFSVTPNASQALQAALQTDKPVFLEFYGNG